MAWLNFPGPRGPAYPLCGHRAVAEFREMLTAIDPAAKTQQYWDGALFVGVAGERDHEWDFMFRGRKDGICFPLSAEDWSAVRELFRRGWEVPEVRESWAVLTMQVEAQ